MIITHNGREFTIGDQVGETGDYRLYLCEEDGCDGTGLLQVATRVAANGGLDRAAFVLRELERTAASYEKAYAAAGGDGLLSYERLFPRVADSFIPEGQGLRRVTVFTFSEVPDARSLVPLSNIRERDGLRVSLRSSAWIMGRLLKLLAFVHGETMSIGLIGANNVLIEPTRHFALMFDWSHARTYPDLVPVSVRKHDIADAARAVLFAIGASASDGYPYPNDADEERYVRFLMDLAQRPPRDATVAHDRFYELVNDVWGRTFTPFETLPA